MHLGWLHLNNPLEVLCGLAFQGLGGALNSLGAREFFIVFALLNVNWGFLGIAYLGYYLWSDKHGYRLLRNCVGKLLLL